jgi:hypothetical protein
VVLVFHAPPACPDRERFVSEIQWRTQRVVWSPAGAPTDRRLSVSVSAAPSGFAGLLVLERPGAPALSRQFEDIECAQVLSALALVAALSLDPQASQEPVVDSSPSTAGKDAAANPNAAARGVGPLRSARLVRRATQPAKSAIAGAPAPMPQAASQAGGSPDTSADWHARAGLSATPFRGMAAVPLIAFGPSVGADWHIDDRLSLVAQATPMFAQAGIVGPSDEEAAYRWLGARAEICGHAQVAARVETGPCVVSDLGELAVEAKGVPIVHPRRRPWSAVGLAADIESASQPFVRLSLALTYPFVRDRFVVRPDEPLHRAAWAVASVSFSVGLRFPK